ncbi:hypothetical protein J7F03_39325 [Streptomyces sp. ISL-43]|uniref:hypothetical protein n=1 Tax=Streptomyces sp. ISL-43 TaxID=2819183 RepID=UPI001BEADBB8|nr:hypothetical protein [Streptomyces sp. ISL-43]MBT2452978.1 hypothetical protein [Streptomyces sp. ISL-43]
MALQISYRGFLLGADLEITVYWFPREPDRPADYVTDALGAWHTSMPNHVDVSGTPEEITSWTTAAALFVKQIAAEQEELRKAQRRIRRWDWTTTYRRVREKHDDAQASFLERVRPAAAAYQPVRDAIEARLAEQEAHARETRRRAYQEEERQRMEVIARFREWESRQEVADRPLSGGLSPRQMAVRGDNPSSWPPEVQAAVGDLAVWWAGVRASVRNRQASAQAVRKVAEAITRTAAALEEAGRPGINTIKAGPHEVLRGWWIHFNWSDLPPTTRLRTPPDVPPGCVDEKRWHYQLFLPSDRIFTVNRSGEFGFATESRSMIPPGGYGYRYKWLKQSIEQFAERLIHTEIIAFRALGRDGHLTFPMTDHADPDAYVPYVEAVAERAAARFHALIPGQL